MSNYMPLNIQLFADHANEVTTFQVDVYKQEKEDGSIEVTLDGNMTMYNLYSQKYNRYVSSEWSDSFPISTVSRIFTEPYNDTIVCMNKLGEEYIIDIDVNPVIPTSLNLAPSISTNGIISLNGIDFSNIQFNNNQITDIYYNNVCIWTINKISNNTLYYKNRAITYNNQYVTYEIEK